MLGYGVGTSIDEPDSISDGFYNITVDENTAIIVFRDATGSTNTEQGYALRVSDEQTAIIVKYPEAIWMYSLYPKIGKMIMTSHSNGPFFASGWALSKNLIADCSFREY